MEEQNQMSYKTKKRHPKLRKAALTGLGAFTLLYASNGFQVRDTINNGVREAVHASVNAVTVDVSEAAERLYTKVEGTEDLSPYIADIEQVMYALHDALPPEEKVATLETLLQQTPEPVQQLLTQSMYASQPKEFRTRFIESNIADMSEEERARLRREITTHYLEEKKDEFFNFLDDVRDKLRPIYENVRDAVGLYSLFDGP